MLYPVICNHNGNEYLLCVRNNILEAYGVIFTEINDELEQNQNETTSQCSISIKIKSDDFAGRFIDVIVTFFETDYNAEYSHRYRIFFERDD